MIKINVIYFDASFAYLHRHYKVFNEHSINYKVHEDVIVFPIYCLTCFCQAQPKPCSSEFG